MEHTEPDRQAKRVRQTDLTRAKNRDLVVMNADVELHDLLFSYRRIATPALKRAALRAVQSIAAIGKSGEETAWPAQEGLRSN